MKEIVPHQTSKNSQRRGRFRGKEWEAPVPRCLEKRGTYHSIEEPVLTFVLAKREEEKKS